MAEPPRYRDSFHFPQFEAARAGCDEMSAFAPRAQRIKALPVTSQSLGQDLLWRDDVATAQPAPGMLRRHRRFFVLLAFGLLATPLVVGMLRPDSPELIFKEGRKLAPSPAPPSALEDLRALPTQI